MKRLFVAVMCVGHMPLVSADLEDDDRERAALSRLQGTASGLSEKNGRPTDTSLLPSFSPFTPLTRVERKRPSTSDVPSRSGLEQNDEVLEGMRRARPRLLRASSVTSEQLSLSSGSDDSDTVEHLSLLAAAQRFSVVTQDKLRTWGFLEGLNEVVAHPETSSSRTSQLQALLQEKEEAVEGYASEQVKLLKRIQTIVARELEFLERESSDNAVT